jgi:hypothetical protein
VFAIVVALFSDGRLTPKWVSLYGGFLFVGFVVMTNLDKGMIEMIRDLGQLRVRRG